MFRLPRWRQPQTPPLPCLGQAFLDRHTLLVPLAARRCKIRCLVAQPRVRLLLLHRRLPAGLSHLLLVRHAPLAVGPFLHLPVAVGQPQQLLVLVPVVLVAPVPDQVVLVRVRVVLVLVLGAEPRAVLVLLLAHVPVTPHRVLAAVHSHVNLFPVPVFLALEQAAVPVARVVLVAVVAAVLVRNSVKADPSVVRRLKSSSRVV